ncbi:C-GCAxxG-C-C family protein [Desulfocurvus sp.]|uniref:split-Soret cytochrome c n=1 Tax=Desulfocurvus sp. TaxID=2871698 RepID=UPI0025BD542B|nr:C-GCAxxG-C-C family protein [Desulfocurvus sp.]MCK9240467.1 C-GCAxxG-C-C family protein [Desulfocurvus sp.]
MTCVSRRNLLCAMGGAVVGGFMGIGPLSAALPEMQGQATWTAHSLDADECEPYAYAGYWNQGYGCCYGTFYSIVGVMGLKHGAPYNQFPFHIMEVGKSGISDWGTICGALLGAASAMALFWGRKERDPMVTDLFRWYEQTAFPLYDPGQDAQGVQGEIPGHACGSVLCHVSVSSWSFATGIPAASKTRSERCARITADVARKAIEIMNAKIGGRFAPVYGKPESLTYCGECHDKEKEAPFLKGRQECTPCHSGTEHTQNKFTGHP